jgi:uncharacterized protein (DUF2342 family)
MITFQTMRQGDEVEEDLRVWLKTKSTEEFRQFLASPWIALLFSPETIEELYQELQQQEASSLPGTEEYYVEEYIIEVGLD